MWSKGIAVIRSNTDYMYKHGQIALINTIVTCSSLASKSLYQILTQAISIMYYSQLPLDHYEQGLILEAAVQ